MDLQKEYRRILDTSFEKHFPGWRQISPLDPVRVLSDAIVESLSEIERRQTRFFESLMDAVPSISGFSPKPAGLPIQLLELQPSRRLEEFKAYGADTLFRFQKDASFCYALSESSFVLHPAFDLKSEITEPGLHLKFKYQGSARELEVAYIPDPLATTTRLSQVRLFAGGKEVDSRSLLWSDDTADFSRNGRLQVFPRSRGDLLFQSRITDVELILIFDRGCPSGSFVLNLVPCKIAGVEERCRLGVLRGEPWEEVPLNPELVEIPSECTVEFVDEKQGALKRCDDRLLFSRNAQSEDFSDSFFYNAVNHSILVPNADRLLARYNGTAALVCRKALTKAPLETIPEDYRPVLGDYTADIEKLIVRESIRNFSPREGKAEYLRRFYAKISTLEDGERTIRTSEVRPRLLTAEPTLRCVEMDLVSDKQHLRVFLLTENPEHPFSLTLDPGLIRRVQDHLSRLLPLTATYEVLGFRRTGVDIDLRCNVPGLMSSNSETLHPIAERFAELLAPPPFGSLHPNVQYSFKDLAGSLGPRSNGNSLILEGTFTREGIHRSHLSRLPGEVLIAKTKIRSFVNSSDTVRGEPIYAL